MSLIIVLALSGLVALTASLPGELTQLLTEPNQSRCQIRKLLILAETV